MLHENAKQRIKDLIPREYDIQWLDPLTEESTETTVDLDHRQVSWANDDSPTPYPAVILNFDPGSTPRGDIGHVFSDGTYKVPRPDDESIAYEQYSAKPMSGTLNVVVATNTDEQGSGGSLIPKRVIADSIAMQIFQTLEFESDHLTDPGVDPDGEPLAYSWPVHIRGIGTDGMADTSRMLDEQSIQRRHMQWRIDYAYFHEETVPATAAIEYTLGMDHNRDGEFEDIYTDERIEFYDYNP